MSSACNQTSYFEREKRLFNVDGNVAPFFSDSFSSKTLECFPVTECEFLPFLFTTNDKLEVIEYNTTNTANETNYITTVAPYIWRLFGWKSFVFYDEEYWVYENTHTDNIAFYFHGLNAFDGLDNFFTLRQLTYNASVYFPVYKHTYLTSHSYNHSFTEHIDNVFKFMDLMRGPVSIIGHSFGCVRVTHMCVRYDCRRFSKIVLLDPININVPFSMNFKQILFGLVFKSDLTVELNGVSFIQLMRSDKQRYHLFANYRWKDWSIDSEFLRKYIDNLVLVIGDNDYLISIDKTSVSNMANTIYTNTAHGMVLFTRIFNEIQLFGPKKHKEIS
jgi:hypothetical protein